MKNIGNKYPWQGLLFATAFILIGAAILFFTGILQIDSMQSLIDYLSTRGFEAIFSAFFVGVGIYIWILYVRNVFSSPKDEVLFLLEIDAEGICTFLNKKGKKYYYNNENFMVNKYYRVLKSADHIYKVREEVKDSFESIKVKESYWLNFYSPVGNFENIMLLPIVYVIALPGILSLLIAKGFYKIYGIIYAIVPVFIIVYDAIYKHKKYEMEDDFVDVTPLNIIFVMLVGGLKILLYVVVIWCILRFMINIADFRTQLLALPFVLSLVCALGISLAKAFNKEKLQNVFSKISNAIFFIFWYSIIAFAVYSALQSNDTNILIMAVIFAIAGIFFGRSNKKRNDRR